jgi:ribose transport system substrate-binding protein
MCAVTKMDARGKTWLAIPVLVVLTAAIVLAVWNSRRPMVVAVIPETTAQEIWEAEHAGTARAAHSLGWKVYWNGPSREDDFPRQVQIVQQAISRGVIGLVLSPDHNVVLISAVQAALDNKIPVAIVGSPLGISPGKGLTFVLNDDAAMGRMAAERAAQYLKPGDTVAVLGMNPNLLSSIERAHAFEDAIRARVDDVHVDERHSTSASTAEAEEAAERLIQTEPHLRVIVALSINHSRAAYGALLNTRSEGIRLIACDQDLDLLHHLRSGSIDSLIAQDTHTMGYTAVDNIHKQRIGTSVQQLTVVPPVLITRENIDSESVQRVLDMDWRVSDR